MGDPSGDFVSTGSGGEGVWGSKLENAWKKRVGLQVKERKSIRIWARSGALTGLKKRGPAWKGKSLLGEDREARRVGGGSASVGSQLGDFWGGGKYSEKHRVR